MHLPEKVAEREEVINRLMIILEGLEKSLDVTAIDPIDSGTS